MRKVSSVTALINRDSYGFNGGTRGRSADSQLEPMALSRLDLPYFKDSLLRHNVSIPLQIPSNNALLPLTDRSWGCL